MRPPPSAPRAPRRASWSAWSPRAAGCRAPAFSVVSGGEVVGEVTSGAPSPTLGKPIAMAYVDAAHATPGTEGVAVDIRGAHEPYEVVALPFYKRQK